MKFEGHSNLIKVKRKFYSFIHFNDVLILVIIIKFVPIKLLRNNFVLYLLDRSDDLRTGTAASTLVVSKVVMIGTPKSWREQNSGFVIMKKVGATPN